MKKSLLVLLTIILCVSMCACGQSKEEIIEKLESRSWTCAPLLKYNYKFEDGNCTFIEYPIENGGYGKNPIRSHYGSYSITGIDGEHGWITLHLALTKGKDDNDYKPRDKVWEVKLYYTYEDDFLRVYFDEEYKWECK